MSTPLKLWIKISSENRRQGSWFFDLEYARQCSKSWEQILPVEFPEWPNVTDDADHSKDGEFAGLTFPELVDAAYRRGVVEGEARERARKNG